MAEKKVTKKEYFAILRNIVAENKENPNRTPLLDFIDHEVELLDKKKSSNGNSKTAKEQTEAMEKILAGLEEVGRPITITELQNEVAELAPNVYSNQKVSHMLKKLVESGQVVRTMDKKKAYFSLAE